MPDPLDLDFPDDREAFEEAVRAFLARTPVDPETWRHLTQAERERAFMIAHVTQADVLNDAMAAITRAMDEGSNFEDFKREIGPALEDAWQGDVANPSARLETIFRTNTATAYGQGHYRQMQDPAVKRARPYWKYVAIEDQRTSKWCGPLDGVIRPADDPWWRHHFPPLHFNCRSTVVNLTEEEAQQEGITGSIPSSPAPLPGFGNAPSAGAPAWDPLAGDMDPEIKGALADKLHQRTPDEEP